LIAKPDLIWAKGWHLGPVPCTIQERQQEDAMTTTVLTLALVAFLPADPPSRKDAPRERHPLAPSLPLLTEEEEAKIERIIDRFVAYDIGKLRGPEGLKALDDFKRLGPEAIPMLIDGLNRTANYQHTCPAVIIARKLGALLVASDDQELLDFARENIGAGVTAKRHVGVIKDLRVACMLRKSALQRRALAAGVRAGGEAPALRSRSLVQLVEAAGSERGPRLKAVLVELEQRKGDQVLGALSAATGSYETDVQQLARNLLVRHLARQNAAVLKEKLKDDRPAVRAAAARAVGAAGLRWGGELLELLDDNDADVQQAARQALVQLAGGIDYGPPAVASATARSEAARQWTAWWARQTGK
jgi:hypothetical protein